MSKNQSPSIQADFKHLYPKLSAHYFFYFAVLGALLPYLGLYFQSLAFTPVEIGQLMGVLLATKVVAPNIWGWLADRSGKHIKWVRIATGLAFIMSSGLLLFSSFWALLATIFFFSFFWHASLPQFESFTFTCLGQHKQRYGLIRLWGSIGFIAAVLCIGWQIEQFSINLLPLNLLLLLAIVWLSSFGVRDRAPQRHPEEHKGFAAILKHTAVWHLLVVSFLVQFSHGVYYTFFTIHLNELGYSESLIAWLWALGVIAEVAVFFFMVKLFAWMSVRHLILISIALTVLRWLMNATLAEYLGWMVFAQILHAASFGLFHAAAIHLIDQHFRGPHHGKGQAIFAASSHGLGGALGMLLAGYAWSWGHAELAYGLSAMMGVLAFIMAYRGITLKSS